MKRRECWGGRTGHCPHAAIWTVRLPGDSDRNATPACGKHLHSVADEITGGEQMELDLRRITTDER